MKKFVLMLLMVFVINSSKIYAVETNIKDKIIVGESSNVYFYFEELNIGYLWTEQSINNTFAYCVQPDVFTNHGSLLEKVNPLEHMNKDVWYLLSSYALYGEKQLLFLLQALS